MLQLFLSILKRQHSYTFVVIYGDKQDESVSYNQEQFLLDSQSQSSAVLSFLPRLRPHTMVYSVTQENLSPQGQV